MIALKILVVLVGLAPLAWALIKGGIGKEGKDSYGDRAMVSDFRADRIVLGLIIAALLIPLASCFGQVPAGYRGVVLKFDATTGEIKQEGFYTVFPPYIKRVELMSVQVRAWKHEVSAASKDLQMVTTEVVLNFALEPDKVADIYKDLRHEYLQRVVGPGCEESVKASTAQFTAEELITRRPEVRDAMDQALANRLSLFGVGIRAFSITNFDFTTTFADAIEAKVTAEQKALQAERDLERIKLEAQQEIEKAKAQAEALRLQKESVTPELVRLRSIEAQMKAVEKWDGVMPQVVTGAGPVPMLNVFAPTK